jgi:hypothetical protein
MVPGMVDALDEGVARHTRLLYAQRKAGASYMAVDTRRLYRSANGDRWDLARDTATGFLNGSIHWPLAVSRANAIRILELTSESTKRLAVCLDDRLCWRFVTSSVALQQYYRRAASLAGLQNRTVCPRRFSYEWTGLSV